MPEQWLIDALLRRCLSVWKDGELYPNLPDVIAAQRGWHPLQPGEKMTVHFDGQEYEVLRKE